VEGVACMCVVWLRCAWLLSFGRCDQLNHCCSERVRNTALPIADIALTLGLMCIPTTSTTTATAPVQDLAGALPPAELEQVRLFGL
jgi:hypothetical protein